MRSVPCRNAAVEGHLRTAEALHTCPNLQEQREKRLPGKSGEIITHLAIRQCSLVGGMFGVVPFMLTQAAFAEIGLFTSKIFVGNLAVSRSSPDNGL